jgi:WD40 repeat protein
MVATGSHDATARLWDAATGRPLTPSLVHQGPVAAVAFSPDGHLLATASSDHTARFWDTATGEPLGPPLPHRSAVTFLAFRPDGQNLLTRDTDGAARLWPVPAPLAGDVGRINLWLQAATGMELDQGRAAGVLDAATWQERGRRLDELGGPPGP